MSGSDKLITIASCKDVGVFSVHFFFFLFITLLIFFAFRAPLFNGIVGLFQQATLPVQGSIHTAFWGLSQQRPSDSAIVEENKKLRERLIIFEELKKENNALHDQFETTELATFEQIPVRIVGSKGLIPGVSLPSQVVIDKGQKNNITVGNAVVYENNLVGKVIKVTPRLAVVDPITKNGVTFTGKGLQTNALGVVRGQGDNIILDNVVLSDKLNVGDIVVTKGDLNESGVGLPSDLVVGKISSVDRRPSNLFQSAEIQSLIDITKLTTVFVLQIKQ